MKHFRRLLSRVANAVGNAGSSHREGGTGFAIQFSKDRWNVPATLPRQSRLRHRVSRIVLLGCALVLGVVATAALPERANAQVAFAASKNICTGIPDPINNNPNTCPYAPIVGVGQQVFYVIKVTNPPGSIQQNITLTEHYPLPFGAVAIACTDQTTTLPPLFLNTANPPVISFQLPMDTTVTCTIAGTFNAAGLQNNIVDVDNKVSPVQSPSVQTTVAPTTQLPTDLSVTKSVSPSPIGVGTPYPLPAIVTYTVTIKNNGPAVDVGHWFVLHDTLALLPNSVPLYATVVAGSFTCGAIPATTDCLAATPTNVAPTPQLIGTMAPHPMFDWSFPLYPTGQGGHIDAGATITLTWKVKIEKLPTLSCVKSLTSNGLRNQVYFTLTNPDGTAANDINNANNTASAALPVTLAGTVDPNCGTGQLTMTKTQQFPANPVAWGMPPTWPPTAGTVTYDITIKNTSMPQQTITIPGNQLQDFVVEGIGTPPFTRTFVSATCLVSVPAAICNDPITGFNVGVGGGGNPPPPAPLPSTATQSNYTYYGQQILGWSSNPTKPLKLAYGNSVTIRIAFNYYGPDCETVPNVTPKLIVNKAQIVYMATAVGAAVGSQQNVQYTQIATANTQMTPQQPCKFLVAKVFHPGSPKTVQFGGQPVVYDVTFTNNDASRTIGTVMDTVRITDVAYATQVPFTSSWTCNQIGGVAPLPVPPTTPVNGTAIYTNSPAQGTPVFQFTNLQFNNGAQLSCTVTITVNRPLPNNPKCSMNQAYFENLALMDVTQPYNTNVPWPPSGNYNPSALSNPTPQGNNWATLQAPLPKCYNVNIKKTASVNAITTTNPWTSPNGPPVNYAITVTNTGTSGALTGSGTLSNWNGLLVGDVVSPLYGGNPVQLTNPPNCPGTWCTPLAPAGVATATAASSFAGIGTPPLGPPGLAASAFGTWGLTLQPLPPFTAGTYIKNCAAVNPAGTFAGQDYYSNYDLNNPPTNPPTACVQVPVLNTTDLGVTKKVVNATGHTLNIPATAFGVNVACQLYPLLSSANPTLTLTIGATANVQNGGSVSVSTLLHNVPVAPGETCTVTEPVLPAVPLGACGKDTVAYWDTTIAPAQVPITAGPNAATVTNTLRCRPTLTVTKTFIDATGSTIPIQPPTFNVQVTCNPLAIAPTTTLSLTPPATATSSSAQGFVPNVPVGPGETCTVSEPVLPPIPAIAQKICGNTAYWDSSPAFAPSQTIPISATGPNAVTVTNTLKCHYGYLAIYKVYDDQTGGTALPSVYASGFPIRLSCSSFPGQIAVPIKDGFFSSNDPALTSGNPSHSMTGASPSTTPTVPGTNCSVTETALPAIQNVSACQGGSASWITTISGGGTASIVANQTATVTVTNTLRCTPLVKWTLEVNKLVVHPVAGQSALQVLGVPFTIFVSCTDGQTRTFQLTQGGSFAGNFIVAQNTQCTVSEPTLPGPFAGNCPVPLTWRPAVIAPAQPVLTGPYRTVVTVTNSYACGSAPPGPMGSLHLLKTVVNATGASTSGLMLLSTQLQCTPNFVAGTVELSPGPTGSFIGGLPAGNTCIVTESQLPHVATAPNCPAGATWSSSIVPTPVPIVANLTQTVNITNTLSCDCAGPQCK
jgi:hypothetical protein